MRGQALLVAGLLLAALPSASASPCGGGSSSGGSSGGSSSSSSSSDSSSSDSSSSTPSCDPANRIVGRNQCRIFGSWDRRYMARMRFEIGLRAGTASVGDTGFDGTVEHEEVHRYHYPNQQESGGDAPQMGSGGFEVGGSGFVGKHLTVGVFSSMEGGGSNAPSRQIGGLRVKPGGIVQFRNGARIGMSLPMGGWTLRGDAAIGVRSTGMTFESQIGDCIKNSTAWNHNLLLEPRVGIEKWLNPWLSAGVMVGSDLMRDNDMSISFGFTGHTSAFDASGVIGLPK